MLNTRTLAAVVVAGTGLVTAAWLPARHDTADASERSRHRTHGDQQQSVRTPLGEPTWRDEFDAPAGTPVDATKWRLETAGARPYEAAHDGEGNLVVTARRDRGRRDDAAAHLVSAGMVLPKYGRVEVRLRTPGGPGPRPALRLLARNLDEIAGTRLHPGLHTYVMDFSPGQLIWQVDGMEYQRVTPDRLDGEFWLVLSLAPGDGGRVLVDHVRVWGDEGPDNAEPSPVPPSSTPPSSTPPSPTPPSSAPPSSAPPSSTPPSSTPPTSAPPAAKKWAPYQNYVAGQQVTYDGATYRVREAHTSLPGWEPPAVPALFAAA